MSETFPPLSSVELEDQRVELLPARSVMTTLAFPTPGGSDVTVVHAPPHGVEGVDAEHSGDPTTGDVTGGDGGQGGGNGGGQGGGNGGAGGAGGDRKSVV